MIRDPRARERARISRSVDLILAEIGEGDPKQSELRSVLVHATAARRRAAEVMNQIDVLITAKPTTPDTRALGDASHAVVSFYIAVSAARRYSELVGEPGPIGEESMRDLESAARHFRDSVMHWDDKLRNDPRTFLSVSRDEALVLAPHARSGEARVAQLTWDEMEATCRGLEEWAASKLDRP